MSERALEQTCWHCGIGTFCIPEPVFDAMCCDFCGRDILTSRGSLPSFDNAGSISSSTSGGR